MIPRGTYMSELLVSLLRLRKYLVDISTLRLREYLVDISTKRWSGFIAPRLVGERPGVGGVVGMPKNRTRFSVVSYLSAT